MSQNPYPYPPPPPYPSPPPSPTVDYRAAWAVVPPHAAGRSAALWQTILGAILFLAGTCVVSVVWAAPDSFMNDVMRQQQTDLPPMQGFTPVQEIRLLASVACGMMIGAGALLLLFSFFVRKGGKASIILSLILNALIALFMLMNLASSFVQLAQRAAAIFPIVMLAGMLFVCGVTIVKLVAALRSAEPAQQLAMQQAYYWMMQQQQAGAYGAGYGPAGYGSGGYGPSGYGSSGYVPQTPVPPPPAGMAFPPQPPPAPPAAPPPPASPTPPDDSSPPSDSSGSI